MLLLKLIIIYSSRHSKFTTCLIILLPSSHQFYKGQFVTFIVNLILNTSINTIKSEKVECMGYVYNGALQPKHWFQFAGNTAIATALERDNQLLCNAFRKWSTWADLIILVDKCHTYSMKSKTKSIQFQSFVTLKKERIPPVKLEESFIYLGKNFIFLGTAIKWRPNWILRYWKIF